ncbi:type I-B CRISPR-associated endonuclease Cas1b [Gramella sp. AN32]|uniref:CRISPR-associated endonuclease Cas1 n=1 Tax=Christiangramia antarctica TaxID=2058158 RepID=A0ABW5X6J9_9FLAO|nr:type I-B CRISPR-associated endonuclease Cas1b [Gramella sp. AN32]MCM4154766.1 subtype I-B CRISPR-associated endonuclease Cas1 [Gramella sp. AN32]
MKKSYYLFNPGRLSRKDNTLKFLPVDEEGKEGKPKYLPVEGVKNLFCFGSLDANSALYNFLGKHQIGVHFFDYYEHYTGSFMPKDYLLSGKVIVNQVKHYNSKKKRMVLAQSFVEGAAFNMLKNLKYYSKRERDINLQITQIEQLVTAIQHTRAIDELMGIEGNIRMAYYSAFGEIINDFEMNNRSKQPPSNEVNAMISFVNMICYTACLDQIYHTQLNPTISFLHEPGFRRYSLALDLAEIFKPLLADRLIFSLLNKKIIQKNDFDQKLNSCLLKESGRKKVMRAWDEKLDETIKHRTLDRSISYKRLIRLECYKLVKHVMGMQEYKPFKMWW